MCPIGQPLSKSPGSFLAIGSRGRVQTVQVRPQSIHPHLLLLLTHGLTHLSCASFSSVSVLTLPLLPLLSLHPFTGHTTPSCFTDSLLIKASIFYSLSSSSPSRSLNPFLTCRSTSRPRLPSSTLQPFKSSHLIRRASLAVDISSARTQTGTTIHNSSQKTRTFPTKPDVLPRLPPAPDSTHPPATRSA
jgi:hypothetical protein